jgi:paraquat-inducible protein A
VAHGLSLARRCPVSGIAANLSLAAAAGAFLVGSLAPLMTLRQLWIFDHTVSLVSGLGALWAEGHYLVFVLIGLFSVAVPALKLGLLAALWNLTPTRQRPLGPVLRLAHGAGRWAMLDVLVVAVLVVAVKLGGLARVEIRYGFYAFAASVLLTMGVTAFSVRTLERLSPR